MQITLPPDLESLIEKRLQSGAFDSVEDVVRHALHVQDEDESWTAEDVAAVERKIERAEDQFANGDYYGREAALQKLAELKALRAAGQA